MRALRRPPALAAWPVPRHAVPCAAARRPARKLVLATLLLAIALPLPAQEILVPNGALWRWRKGTNEASSPASLWRNAAFNDSAWATGSAPFHFGTNASGGDDQLTGGTILGDMRNSYRGIFLRRAFVLTNVADIASATLAVNYDDGYVAWINGVEVTRNNVTGEPTYLTVANSSLEPAGNVTNALPLPPQNYFALGTNVLAIQAFNNAVSGSDFRLEARLEITRANLHPPVLTNRSPAPDSVLGALTQVTVWFDQPVTGVDAADLLINDQPADAVSGNPGTNRYTFTFTQPPPGLVGFGWSDAPDITSLNGTPFDATAPGASWTVMLTDTVAPEITTRAPVAGATVSQFTQVELYFSEPVFGVDATDLLVNGVPATNVVGSEAGPYVFAFAAPAPGLVNLTWAGGHGITDDAGNPFAGAGWSVTLNPALEPGNVVLNEFLAGNFNSLVDEDGERHDWIELHNRGLTPVNLLGWSLTDDANVPGKWTFPSRVLSPGEYLVVFASGKDRRAPAPGNRFHTNFKLDLFGEHLALYNAEFPRVAVTAFTPRFPEQRNNYSYGRDPLDQWRYYATPTPGGANGGSTLIQVAAQPHFSVGRGLFEQPFQLLLSTTVPGGTIRYTLNGSEPTAGNGFPYTGPIAITNTTIVRAVVLAPNHLPSRVRTHSYIYLDSILTQPANPPGFPATWGTAANFPGNIVPAYYPMDLDPVRVNPLDSGSPIDPEKLERLKRGLREFPVVSLVLDVNDMFGPNGLYPKSTSANKSANEKPCAVEMLLPDGGTGFVADAGIDLHGNASRDPFKTPKHGFKLNFKADYGPTTLEAPGLFPGSAARKFDDLILRPDFGVSWLHWSDVATEGLGAFQRTRAIRFRDAFIKHSFRDLGHPASFNRYVHLMINGLYWGLYDLSEQPFPQFAENYFPASTNGYDIYDQGLLKTNAGGTATAYNAMLAINNLANNANYEALKQYLDVPQFSDYMLLHFLFGAQDWGNNKNWFAIRPRLPGPDGRFRYLPWDGENTLLNENINRVPNAGGSTDVPSGLFTKLDDNAQFRLDFADRVHKHMIAPDGALTVANNLARWQFWQAHLDAPIVAESCRWGDYRRDIHPYLNGVFTIYTRENQWLAEHDRIQNSYLPNRHTIVLNQFRAAGLYPAIDAPEFRQGTVAGPLTGGGAVPAGFTLAMRNPGGGTIYYTTNGADPRVYYSGLIASDAQPYVTPLPLNASVTIKARVLQGATWSALNEATFTVGEFGLPLRITEILYNPTGGNAYEFLELQNVGALPVNVGGFSFSGITFSFPPASTLAPGQVIVLANNANPVAWAARYPGVTPFGYYGGNLDNAGERIALLDAQGRTIIAVHYDDEGGWDRAADGGGYSLEIVDPRGDPNAPANWRASSFVNGTPGLPPVAPPVSDVVINEVAADNATTVQNGGTFPDWVELHNRGTTPADLTDWGLTDNSNPRQFVFPPGTVIPPGGYLVVWCDTATNAPGLHAGFSLAKGGETVSLYDPASNRVDAVTYGLQLTDYTVSRIGGEWRLALPTPGAANLAAPVGALTNVTVNEWLADSPPGAEDWFELFNRSTTHPVALRGLGLSTSNAQFSYRALSFLPPLGHAQFFADELPGANHVEFKLPAAGGFLALHDETGAEFERVTYGPQSQGVSEGRLPDGATNLVAFPGSTSPGAANYLLAWTGPVLSELLARNAGAVNDPWGGTAGFIELVNPGTNSFALTGLRLGRSTATTGPWTFPAGVNLPGGGHLVVWCDPTRPASTTTNEPLNTGWSLFPDSGAVWLFNSAGQPVDGVEYGFQVRNLPLGRHAGEWRLLANATPGTPNTTPAALGPASALRFNEWMAAPLAGDDWFELFNTSPLPVDLGGLLVTDDPSVTGIARSPIAPLSYIGGRQWVLFIASGSKSLGRNHAAFALAKDGETLRLYDAATNLIDAVDFGVQADGISQGRLPDGSANLVAFPDSPTPGSANTVPPTGSVSLPGNGLVRLTFAVQPGVTYQVEYKNALTDAAWLPLGGPVTPNTPSLEVDEPPALPARYYRLRVVTD